VLTPEDAAAELLRRRMARQGLLAFTRYTFPDYRPAPHHRLITDTLDAVARGEKRRVMIFMPPRFGKSELASKRFPAFFLGANPKKNIIAASYNSDLASDFGREVRGIVASPEYQALFDVTLSQDSKAANRWHTDQRGMYVAAGVGGSLTGRGAHVALIDDPFKNREEADSEVIREKVWRWYTSTAYTRLESDIDPADVLEDDWLWRDFQRAIENGKAAPSEGALILIMTRWHEDDLGGRLLKQMDEGGEKWEVLELPAIRHEAGEEVALWPAKYPIKRLRAIRNVIGPRDWSALYQQSPAPDEGLYFKREWLRYYDELPKHLRFYGASDYAVTANGGDYTVHGTAGVDPEDNLYVADLWRQQTDSNVWIDALCDLITKRKPLMWAEEQGQILKSLGPFIERRMRERRAYCAREQFTSASDKPTRARSFQARMAMGKVYLPRSAPWLADFEAELLSFPAGVHDDQVDMLGLIGRLLDVMVAAHVPPVLVIDNTKDYGQVYGGADESNSWRTA
jgi:predicted phage terminase large subunit-like protein